MSQPIPLCRIDSTPGIGLRAVLAAQENAASETPVPFRPLYSPPKDPDRVKAECDAFTLTAFTASDAWELGHLLYARLLPLAQSSPPRPTVISITAAGSNHVLFQAAVGGGTTPDNDAWVARKRNTVLRFGTSSFFQHCKYGGDEGKFRAAKFGGGEDGSGGEEAGRYAIHGGAVPVFVDGVEGVVAVVVVSGLKHWEDHGVVVDVVQHNWC